MGLQGPQQNNAWAQAAMQQGTAPQQLALEQLEEQRATVSWSIIATDAYCNEGELPPRSQGKTPSGKHASQGACQEWCVGDTTCNYYLYRYDPKKNPNYICQRFTSCDSTHSFTQGDGGHIYGKPWSIMATDAYCNKGELPPRSQGKTPSGKHASQGACQEWCVGDTKCN